MEPTKKNNKTMLTLKRVEINNKNTVFTCPATAGRRCGRSVTLPNKRDTTCRQNTRYQHKLHVLLDFNYNTLSNEAAFLIKIRA